SSKITRIVENNMLPVLPKTLNTSHNQLPDITTNTQNSPPRVSPTQSVNNKRSPSMIFRIEHLLPNASSPPISSSALNTTPTERTMNPTDLPLPKKTKIMRAGVHVTQLIPRDTVSESLDAQTAIIVTRATCHLTFETPNPLKIHLPLGCGRHNIDILWIRLYYAIKASHYTQHMLPLSLTLPSTTTASRLSPVCPTSSATSSSISPLHSPQASTQLQQPLTEPSVSRFSAFKPISSSASIHHHQHLQTSLSSVMNASLVMPPHHTTTAPLSFLPSISSAAMPHMSLLQPPTTSPLNAAAQIEAIVSNMGASKQGHLCIYCGKVYSRKYGLKIHIRTHTGFKPLKCKFCLRPFGDPSNLNKHVRLHLQNSANSSSSTEGYQCNMCHKILGRRRDLQKHMETRHGYSSSATTSTTNVTEKNETTSNN
ncbi:hypothetical protein DOY81_012568, partial [Sarcophaga bullata]